MTTKSACARFTVAAGRQIYRDGKPYISIGRQGDTEPTDADTMTRKIAAMLNEQQACAADRRRLARKPKIRKA